MWTGPFLLRSVPHEPTKRAQLESDVAFLSPIDPPREVDRYDEQSTARTPGRHGYEGLADKLFGDGHPNMQKCFPASYWHWHDFIDTSKTGDAAWACIVIEPTGARCEPVDKQHKQTSTLLRREAMAGALR